VHRVDSMSSAETMTSSEFIWDFWGSSKFGPSNASKCERFYNIS
jgi:hypothetical protein